MFLQHFIGFLLLVLIPTLDAVDVTVLGNSTKITKSLGQWNYSSDICPNSGFLASTAYGAFTTLVFKGTAVSVALLKVHNGALATVYLDESAIATDINLVDPQAQARACISQTVNSPLLPDIYHNVTIVHSGRSAQGELGQSDWLVLLEIIYSTSDDSPNSNPIESATPSPKPSASANLPTVIGGTVAGVIGGLSIGLLAAWFFIRRRHQRKKSDNLIDLAELPLEENTDLLTTPYYFPTSTLSGDPGPSSSRKPYPPVVASPSSFSLISGGERSGTVDATNIPAYGSHSSRPKKARLG